MISYEDELLISDALVRRRTVQTSLKASGAQPTRSEALAISRGNEAAGQLVEAYRPLLRALANQASRESSIHGNHVGIEDLCQEGARTMLVNCNAFDARGSSRIPCEREQCAQIHSVVCTDPECDSYRRLNLHCPHQRCSHENPGLRFASYCRMHVKREMESLVTKSSTPVSAAVGVISATWLFIATQAELMAQLGRWPTDAEVEEKCGVSSEKILADLPSRVGSSDVADVSDDDIGTYTDIESDLLIATEVSNGALEEGLRAVLRGDVVDVLLSLLGVDRGHPRIVAEVAKELGLPRKVVTEWERYSYDAIKHPQIRVKLALYFRELREAGLDI